MVTHHLNLKRISILKFKAYAPLIIDADTPLARPVTGQSLKPITGWDAQRFHVTYMMHLRQLAPRHLPDARGQATHPLIRKKGGTFFIGKCFNHGDMI